MDKIRDCFGRYENKQGQCESCPLVLLCIDTTIEIDRHIDELAERQADIHTMEQDSRWCYELASSSMFGNRLP